MGIAGFAILGFGSIANAAFFGLLKSIKAPADRVEMTAPNSDPSGFGSLVVEHSDGCELKKVGLFGLPKALNLQFDRNVSDRFSLDDQCVVEI